MKEENIIHIKVEAEKNSKLEKVINQVLSETNKNRERVKKGFQKRKEKQLRKN